MADMNNPSSSGREDKSKPREISISQADIKSALDSNKMPASERAEIQNSIALDQKIAAENQQLAKLAFAVVRDGKVNLSAAGAEPKLVDEGQLLAIYKNIPSVDSTGLSRGAKLDSLINDFVKPIKDRLARGESADSVLNSIKENSPMGNALKEVLKTEIHSLAPKTQTKAAVEEVKADSTEPKPQPSAEPKTSEQVAVPAGKKVEAAHTPTPPALPPQSPPTIDLSTLPKEIRDSVLFKAVQNANSRISEYPRSSRAARDIRDILERFKDQIVDKPKLAEQIVEQYKQDVDRSFGHRLGRKEPITEIKDRIVDGFKLVAQSFKLQPKLTALKDLIGFGSSHAVKMDLAEKFSEHFAKSFADPAVIRQELHKLAETLKPEFNKHLGNYLSDRVIDNTEQEALIKFCNQAIKDKIALSLAENLKAGLVQAGTSSFIDTATRMKLDRLSANELADLFRGRSNKTQDAKFEAELNANLNKLFQSDILKAEIKNLVTGFSAELTASLGEAITPKALKIDFVNKVMQAFEAGIDQGFEQGVPQAVTGALVGLKESAQKLGRRDLDLEIIKNEISTKLENEVQVFLKKNVRELAINFT